jgi:ferrochelatase
MPAPIGVLLFNLGGPDTLAAVEPFLVRLFSDREIIELPGGAALQPLLARIIAKARGRSVRRNYAQIGGGSPQLRLTRAQAAALEQRLNAPGGAPYRVVVGMRYSEPFVDEALDALSIAGVQRVVTLTLFPHWSKATTGSSRSELDRTIAAYPRLYPFEFAHVDCYPEDPLYLDALTDTVRRGLERFAPEARGQVVLLFSAHGLPQKFIDAGDPYAAQIEATRQGVLARLGAPNRHVLGYQSRTGPVVWQGPGTEELLDRLGAEGVRHVLVVPLSFVGDHIETLYEVDILYKAHALACGIREYRRSEALNTHPTYIEALAGLVERSAAAAGWLEPVLQSWYEAPASSDDEPEGSHHSL